MAREYIPDLYDMWELHDIQQEMIKARLPKCENCGAVLEEYMYEIDNEILCEDCVDKLYLKTVEVDYDW